MSTPKLPILPTEEWDFSEERVPGRELWGCLLWEYARESMVIANLTKLADELNRASDQGFEIRRENYATREEYWSAYDAARRAEGDLRRQFEVESSAIILPMPFHATSFIRLVEHGVFPASPVPWQSLDGKKRERVIKGIRHKEAILDGGESDVSALADHCARERVRLGEEFDKKHGPEASLKGDMSLARLLTVVPKPQMVASDGTETCIISIRWNGFSEQEILASFKRFIKTRRPANHPERRRKGVKDSDARAALRNLGFARGFAKTTLGKAKLLWREFHTAFVKSAHGDALDRTGLEKIKNDRKAMAVNYFHKIFPFEAGAMPLFLAPAGS